MRLRRRVRAVLSPIPGAMPVARAVVETVTICLRYRVTGLASEAAFFTLLSLPPLFLGVIAGVGFLGRQLGDDAIGTVTSAIEDYSRRFLTEETVTEVISPTIQETLQGGRGDLLSIGFLLSFWSGSRALHVFMDTIGIMYGQNGERGILRARAMSLTLYMASIVAMGVTLPLVFIGPSLLREWIPPPFSFVVELYWPVVSLLGLVSLTGLFHFATPSRSPFYRDFPGAILAVLIWVLSSLILRSWATQAIGGSSVYGPLSAPIVLMIWLYFMSIAVLIGAALNAAIRRLWPSKDYRGPVSRASEWWDQRRTDSMPIRERRPLSPVRHPEEEQTKPQAS
ncbi:MAG TPA: YihY/virulence factor BrkB family protein [Ornithinimicrobium sp.]|uniref:YihY/virulence factor BrkB family protein n=1 Tax=Ornithinimicrobium sp. TaxID=1977084 RepID=UPI002B46FCB7|nr:YihY/virulence factor BrkB family protein [Ornithinimicrobium sp.]HKJ10910.1 YihY/virulence factor BrkB family protein [Ornithinimicrobium sp.]